MENNIHHYFKEKKMETNHHCNFSSLAREGKYRVKRMELLSKINNRHQESQLNAAMAGSGWPATTLKQRLQRVGCSGKDPTRSEKFQHLSHFEPSARDTPIQTLLPPMRHSPVYGTFSICSVSTD